MKKLLLMMLLTIGVLNGFTDEEALATGKDLCEKDNSHVTCIQMGDIYEKGVMGVNIDLNEALRYYELGCKGISRSCRYAAGIYYDRKEYFKAFDNYEKGCDKNDNSSCYNLGILYYNGRGTRKDLNKALAFFGKSCDLKNQNGCNAYAQVLDEKK